MVGGAWVLCVFFWPLVFWLGESVTRRSEFAGLEEVFVLIMCCARLVLGISSCFLVA